VKTLHLYLTRQVLATLLMTVAVFTFVLLLGNALKEILMLLVNGQATVGLVAEAIGLLMPFVLAFSLPMGLLTATLLVFGRFSADQELTAVRASGVSLLALITPILLLSVALSTVAAWINLQWAPQSRLIYKNLIYRVGLARSTSLLVEDRFLDDFPGYVLYVGKRSDTNLREVLVYQLSSDGKLESRLHAARGEILVEAAHHQVVLLLHDVHRYDLINWDTYHAAEARLALTYRPPPQPKRPTSLRDMTFAQLQQKLEELERLALQPPPSPAGQSLEQLREQQRQLTAAQADLTLPVRVQMHRQVAFSFACIGFTLIGIPLGIRAHRRETSAGMALALVLVATYYGIIIIAQSFQTRPEFAPHLILWLPNLIFQSVGAVLLWRANRGF
jgi:lipopolysaccharide export system permease protein